MSLSIAIDKAQRRKRSTKQYRAEVRMDEITSVAAVATTYQVEDRRGDLAIEAKFQELYALVDREAEKDAIARAYVLWQKAERAEDVAVRGSVDESVDLLRANNPLWIDGAAVPSGSDGAA